MSGDSNPNGPGDGLTDQEPVPRLPRKFFTRLMVRDVIKIAFTAVALVAVLALRKPCGEGVGSFFKAFDAPPDAGPPPTPYRRLTPDEIERTFPGQDAAPTAPGAAGTASPGASSPAAPGRSPR